MNRTVGVLSAGIRKKNKTFSSTTSNQSIIIRMDEKLKPTGGTTYVLYAEDATNGQTTWRFRRMSILMS